VIIVGFATYALFFLTAAYDFGPLLLLIGLAEAVLLYLTYQGTAWARGGLVLVFSISAAELLFSAFETLPPGEAPGAFTLAHTLAYAASIVILLRSSVTAFMRHQRLARLMPQ
jgi:hypothetical protein